MINVSIEKSSLDLNGVSCCKKLFGRFRLGLRDSLQRLPVSRFQIPEAPSQRVTEAPEAKVPEALNGSQRPPRQNGKFPNVIF